MFLTVIQAVVASVLTAAVVFVALGVGVVMAL
jgi:hypothetical protein